MTDKVGIAVGETPCAEDASGMSSSYCYRVSGSNVFGCCDNKGTLDTQHDIDVVKAYPPKGKRCNMYTLRMRCLSFSAPLLDRPAPSPGGL